MTHELQYCYDTGGGPTDGWTFRIGYKGKRDHSRLHAPDVRRPASTAAHTSGTIFPLQFDRSTAEASLLLWFLLAWRWRRSSREKGDSGVKCEHSGRVYDTLPVPSWFMES